MSPLVVAVLQRTFLFSSLVLLLVCLIFFRIVITLLLIFFSFNDTAITEIYTLSLHDALPIFEAFVQVALLVLAVETMRLAGAALVDQHDVAVAAHAVERRRGRGVEIHGRSARAAGQDRKSTRLNSSHLGISYAVFCLKKKKEK